MKIKLRRDPKTIKRIYISMVTDYRAGLPVRTIAKRHKRSIGLVYYAIKWVGKRKVE